MIEIIKELNIEVSKPNVFQAVVAKQYDMNTRFIKATFVDGGDKIFINQSETVSVIINALRPDGESKAFDGVINDDGTVTVPLHSWMLELVGTVTCDISVIDIETDDNKKLTTTSFTLIVEKAAYGGDDITSDPQYDVLVQLLETCSTAGAVAEEALEKSNEANSKYDACVEATEAANEATNTLVLTHDDIVSGGYVKALKELNTGGKFSFWVGTTDEYNALPEKVNNCFYILTDDSSRNEILVTLEELEGQIGTINETDARQDDSINQLEYKLDDKVDKSYHNKITGELYFYDEPNEVGLIYNDIPLGIDRGVIVVGVANNTESFTSASGYYSLYVVHFDTHFQGEDNRPFVEGIRLCGDATLYFGYDEEYSALRVMCDSQYAAGWWYGRSSE